MDVPLCQDRGVSLSLPQVGTVNQDALDDDRKDERVLELAPSRVIDIVLDIDKVKLVVLDLYPLPVI